MAPQRQRGLEEPLVTVVPLLLPVVIALAPQRQRGLEDCSGSAAPAWFGGLQWLRSASVVWRIAVAP